MDERTDEALIGAARCGDQAAFEALYHRYRDWVAGVAFRYCGHREDALDVLQETFAYFFRKLPDFELRCRLKTFLFPVAKHLALNRRRPRPQPPPPRAAVNPREDIDDLLAGLSEAHREVVLMRFVDGLDLKEIAEALAIPVGTVKSRLHNAIASLRQSRDVREIG